MATKPSAMSTKDKIIAAAEKRMRDAGFHGTSFRDIAADVGIKSASVHHHFPTKEDLAAAVVRAYAEREMEVLGDATDEGRKPADLLACYIDLFRSAFVTDGSMCLCGLLASESANLPQRVNDEVQRFFDLNLTWLETVLKRAAPQLRPRELRAKALTVTATLEGALLGAHCYRDIDRFENIARELGRMLLVAPAKRK